MVNLKNNAFCHKLRWIQLACLHDQNKMAFLEGRLLFSQPEQSKKFSKSFDWLKKRPALQKATLVLIM